jgi:hypothetical protein
MKSHLKHYKDNEKAICYDSSDVQELSDTIFGNANRKMTPRDNRKLTPLLFRFLINCALPGRRIRLCWRAT